MSRRDAWLYWGLGLTGFLALVSYRPSKAPAPKLPPGGRGKIEGIGDGDVIHYFTEPSGRIIVSTSAEDVDWSQPTLSKDALPRFTSIVKTYRDIVDEIGSEYHLPSAWFWAIMWAEGADPNAVSPKGALGLMQLLPMHFKPGENPLDPKTNVRAAARYMTNSRGKVGDDLVRQGSLYNAGGPWTNESWLAAGRNPSLTTRWGYPAEPKYLDRVVAANNTFLALPTS